MKRMALAGIVATGLALPAQAQQVTGYWRGTYDCAQGLTGINLTIRQGFGVTIEAVFHFYAVAQNPGVPTGCFRMLGQYDPATRSFVLESDERQWIVQPPNYLVVNFRGALSADGRSMQGRVEGPGCSQFGLQRLERPPLAPPACTNALPLSALPLRDAVAAR
jgi:hypothetical protein